MVVADERTGALDPDTLVDDLMRQWPATIPVFIHWRMKCVGCPFGVFHSIAHACEEHQQEMAPFLAALQAVIEP
jgi:hybrid cluster-associated redox disulfide protein